MRDRIPAQRKSPRRKTYDYTAEGIYFVTICTFQRDLIFGEIAQKQIYLSEIGQFVALVWQEIPSHFANVALDSFVVMPNHLHGLVAIVNTAAVGTTHASSADKKPLKPGSLGAIIGSFKAAASKRVNDKYGYFAPKIWQPRYHDHIVRNNAELDRIRMYISLNPIRWEADEYFRATS